MAKAKKAEAAAAPATGGITAYSVKTKTKNVPMVDPTIDVKSGKYIATGKDADGNKMAAILSKVKAEEHIKNGAAKKGTGWE